MRGMVADLITATTEYAAMIDTALGELSQALVVDPDLARDTLLNGRLATPGKIIFLGLYPQAISTPSLDLLGRPGVIGRGDLLASASAGFEPLLVQLLGDTWFVESLSVAARLRLEGFDRVRFVTAGDNVCSPTAHWYVVPIKARPA